MNSKDRATAYAEAVLSGEIPAGPYVRGSCQRHLNDLECAGERGFYYDEHEAAEAIAFFEECLFLNGGQFEGKPFLLLPWECFIVGSIFGWKRTSDNQRRFRVAYIETAKGPLAIDTPIATPEGWTTMGEIRTGDYVFNSLGKPTMVTEVSPIFYGRDCFRLEFSDGGEIVADSSHRWKTSAHRSGMKPGPRKPGEIKKESYGIRSTQQIRDSLKMGPSGSLHPQAKWNHRIDIAEPLELPEIELPLPPYSLGAWLGDGNTNDARLTVAYSDWQIVNEIISDGIPVQERAKHSETTARVVLGGDRKFKARQQSFQSSLRKLGLLGNKHIPPRYFRAGTSQRLALLQGIMDTDGHVALKGHCEITLCDKRLCSDVAILLRTLGYKCLIKESPAKLNGREVGRRWRISFQAYKSQPPVRLARKVDNLGNEPNTRALCRGRMIVACDPVESVPTRCITVESEDHMFLAGENLIPTCNSGKSPLCAGTGIKGLVADNEPRAEIYAAATHKDQAMVLFRDAVAFYDQSPELQARLIASGVGAMRWNLAYLDKGSFFRVVSSENDKSGLRPHMALLDEIHEHKDGMVIEMLRAGFKFRRQPLSFMITNSGHDKTSVCWEYHDMGAKIACEQIQNDEFFSYICSLDDEDLVDDKYLTDESLWPKVNPSLDYGLPGYDYIRGQITEARSMPSKMATVKRLCFCVWTEALNPWLSAETWNGCRDTEFDESLLLGRRCKGGLDLSSVQDLTALILVFDPTKADPLYRLKTFFWMPGDNLRQKSEQDHVPYDVWKKQGHLFAFDGPAVNKSAVCKFLKECSEKYDLTGVAYDRDRIKDLMEFAEKAGVDLSVGTWDKKKRVWNFEGSGIKMMPFGQTARSMAPALDKFETLLINKEIRHDGNPVMTWCAANAVTKEDEDGYKKVSKQKSTGRVDGVVAGCMACGVLEEAGQKSAYEGLSSDQIKKRMKGE